MPLFMMISGYVYSIAYFDSDGIPDRKRIHQQICNQILVYVIFSIVLAVTKMAFNSSVNNEANMIDILLLVIKPIYPYWYLYVLIILYKLFSTSILNEDKYRYIFLGLSITLAIFGSLTNISLFELSGLLYYMLFFILGKCAGKIKIG